MSLLIVVVFAGHDLSVYEGGLAGEEASATKGQLDDWIVCRGRQTDFDDVRHLRLELEVVLLNWARQRHQVRNQGADWGEVGDHGEEVLGCAAAVLESMERPGAIAQSQPATRSGYGATSGRTESHGYDFAPPRPRVASYGGRASSRTESQGNDYIANRVKRGLGNFDFRGPSDREASG